MSKFVLTAQLKLRAPRNTTQVVNQIRSQLSGLSVPVTVQGAAAAQKQIQSVTSATREATNAAQQMGKSFGLAVKRFAAFTIASRVISAFTAGLGKAVEEALDFQRQMIRISQVTGKTVSELKELDRTITSLSVKWGTLSSDLVGVSRILAQAGIQARDLEVALAVLAKTTLAPTFENIEKTAEGAVAILAQFGEGVGALERQLGAINAVAGKFAVESGDLISAVRRTGGVFRAAGGELEELIGLFTSVRATTRESSESIATGLRTIFTRIQRPKTIEFLKAYGVELTDLEGKFVGPFEAVRRLSAALKGLEQGDLRFVKIAEQLGGFRQIGKVIPLLQEFELAERARQAALAGGDSITKDAITAQQSLSVQILKVKEDFLALVRAITETSSFQIMVKGALNLASALIEIGEAIKPLIPLLGALAAFKMASMVGGFAAGVGAAFRPKHSGGRIHAFARGGMVPGTGNRDTVPAMLSPGEFVIRKSSVQSIGAENLEGINKYGGGGKIEINKGKIGAFFLRPPQGKDVDGRISTTIDVTHPHALKKLGRTQGQDQSQLRMQALLSAPAATQHLLLTGKRPKKRVQKIPDSKSGRQTARKLIASGTDGMGASARIDKAIDKGSIRKPRVGKQRSKGKHAMALDARKVNISGIVEGFFTGRQDLERSSEIASLVSSATKTGMETAITNATNQTKEVLQGIPPIDANEAAAKATSMQNLFEKGGGAIEAIEGYIFEGLIAGITGAAIAGKSAAFDFPMLSGGVKGRLSALFGNEEALNLLKADAKRTYDTGIINNPKMDGSIVRKIQNDINAGKDDGSVTFHAAPSASAKGTKGTQGAQGKAKGGAITDTVPALLTPGEFVVNKKSAQSIGYGSLNKMNKKGVAGFAKGGRVGPQRFATGGSVGAGTSVNLNVEYAQKGLDKLGRSADNVTKNIGDMVGKIVGIKDSFSKLATSSSSAGKTFETIKAPAQGAVLGLQEVKQTFTAAPGIFIKGFSAVTNAVQGGATKLNGVVNELIATLAFLDGKTYSTASSIGKAGTTFKGVDTASAQIKTLGTSAVAASELLVPLFSTNIDKAAVSSVQLGGNLDTLKGKVQNLATALSKVKPPVGSKDSGTSKTNTAILNLGTSAQTASGQINNLSKSVAPFMTALHAGTVAQNAKNVVTVGNTKSVNASTAAHKSATSSMMKMSGSMVLMSVGMLGSLLPAVDENSSMLHKLASQGANYAMQLSIVLMLLEHFGIQLSLANAKMAIQNSMDFLGGGGRVAGKVGKAVSGGMSGAGGWMKQMGGKMQFGKTFAAGEGGLRRGAGAMLSRAGSSVAGAAPAAGNVATGLTKLLGPIVAATAGTWALTAAFDSLTGVHKKAEEAISEGNVAKAGEAAVQSQLAKDANKASMAVAAMSLAIPGIGPVLAVVTGGLTKLALTFTPLGGLLKILRNSALGAAMGLDSLADIREHAEAQAAAAKFQKEYGENTRIASEAMAKISKGEVTAKEGLREGATGTLAAALAQRKEAQESFDIAEAKQGTNILVNDDATEGARDAALQRREKFMKEDPAALRMKKANKDVADALAALNPGMMALSRETLIASAGTASFDDFLDNLEATDKDTYDAVLEAGTNDLRDAFDNQQKAILDNIAFLESLNYGLRDVAGSGNALVMSLDQVAGSQTAGFNQFNKAADIMSLAITSAAKQVSNQELDQSLKTFGDGLRDLGASDDQVKQAQDSVKALNEAQRGAGKALESIKGKLGSIKLTPENLKDELGNEILKNVSDPGMRKRLKASIEGMDLTKEAAEAFIAQIQAGDVGPLLEEMTKEQQEAVNENIEILRTRAEAENKLISAVQERQQAELKYIAAQKKAIDMQLDAAKAFEEFGGAKVTTGQKLDARMAQFNLDAANAGVSGLNTGSNLDINRVGQQIADRYQRQSQQAMVGTMTGDEAFKGAAGVDADERKELQSANDALIKFTQQRISLLKEEMAIVQKKNAAEKSALEKLISGDIEGFLEGQAAAGAGAALRSGDKSLAGLFGSGALGAGFKTLEGQGLSGAQMERAASTTLSAVGIDDKRSAQILAGNTAEEQAINVQGQELAQTLGNLAQQMADMESMNVAAKEVIIHASNVRFEEAKEAADGRIGRTRPGAPVTKARGGMIYANQGMFVPRGTDTVPAMLTPGEFVVNRAAVNRGNNLQILRTMNNNRGSDAPKAGGPMATGGEVGYYAWGDIVKNMGSVLTNAGSDLTSVFSSFADAVDKLTTLRLSVKVDPTNVVVSFDEPFLASLREDIRTELLREVKNEIETKLVHEDNGRHKLRQGMS